MTNEILALHRYFIWANRMRTHFEDVLARPENKRDKSFEIESFMYMSYWYAELYVVIEGWMALSLADDTIGDLLKSPNVDLLKRYRNGVFHFQKDYYDERFMEFMRDDRDCVVWVRSLNEEFGRYFLSILKKDNPKIS